LGFSQPANSEALRFWLAAEEGTQGGATGKDSGKDRLGIRFVTAIALGSTKRVLPLGVQQKLMRHANIATTMNVYGRAFMESKRKANTSVVQRVLLQDHTK